MTSSPSTGAGSSPGAATDSTSRSADDVRLARVHLRLGQLTLARAELEDLLRRDQLDTTSLALLAEARWRTGDGAGAAEAANAHIAAEGSDDIALCIAAEAAALDGRQDDARELMDRLPAADAAALDALFAGMPRRAYWPAGPVDRGDLDELRRDQADRARDAGRRGPLRASGPGRGAVADGQTQAYRQADLGLPEEPADDTPATETVGRAARRSTRQPDPADELQRARLELDRDPDRALLRLALVLRHDPTRAPAVLELLHLRREPRAALLRGDAQRLLGRHLEAEAEFDTAADSLEAL